MTIIDTLEMADIALIEAYGRIEALVQSVLGKVDNIGQQVARQGAKGWPWTRAWGDGGRADSTHIKVARSIVCNSGLEWSLLFMKNRGRLQKQGKGVQ